MKGVKKQIIIRPKATFSRGVLEGSSNGFFTLIIHAVPEDYDYSNWTEEDLKDLAEAIKFILENKESD